MLRCLGNLDFLPIRSLADNQYRIEPHDEIRKYENLIDCSLIYPFVRRSSPYFWSFVLVKNHKVKARSSQIGSMNCPRMASCSLTSEHAVQLYHTVETVCNVFISGISKGIEGCFYMAARKNSTWHTKFIDRAQWASPSICWYDLGCLLGVHSSSELRPVNGPAWLVTKIFNFPLGSSPHSQLRPYNTPTSIHAVLESRLTTFFFGSHPLTI